jgi:hypothetical protein
LKNDEKDLGAELAAGLTIPRSMSDLRQAVFDAAFYSGKPEDPFPEILEAYVVARVNAPLNDRMPQWGVLGIGVEAWVDLNQAERDGIARKLRDTSSVLIRWSTLRPVMNVLRAIKIQDFIRAKKKTRKPLAGNQGAESGIASTAASPAQK